MSSSSDFRQATSIACRISTEFSINGAPNGGYLAELVAATACKVSGKPDVMSLSAHHLRKADEGADGELLLSVLGSGRRLTTMSISLVQAGIVRASYLLTLGDLSEYSGLSHTAGEYLPALSASVDRSDMLNVSEVLRTKGHAIKGPKFSRMFDYFDLLVPKDSDYALCLEAGTWGIGSGKTSFEGWVRMRNNMTWSSRSALWVLDAFPPPVMCLLPAAWVPTLEYTVHTFARPPLGAEWLRVRYWTVLAVTGVLELDAELWDESGKLLARARQLALLQSGPKKGASSTSSGSSSARSAQARL
ncbi:unnamed protein product [Polarella glacialis]|uniref:Thioesterase family protein n=1 Tax=Polarella glacialis TaxID=89957 RepID=A0A813FPJ5_POLGL|nr:unnamed protein product [Polarella glacialis]